MRVIEDIILPEGPQVSSDLSVLSFNHMVKHFAELRLYLMALLKIYQAPDYREMRCAIQIVQRLKYVDLHLLQNIKLHLK